MDAIRRFASFVLSNIPRAAITQWCALIGFRAAQCGENVLEVSGEAIDTLL